MIRVKSLSELTYPKPSLRIASSIPIVNKEQHPFQAERENVNDEPQKNVREPQSGQIREARAVENERGRSKETTTMRLEYLVKRAVAEEELGQGEDNSKTSATSRLEEFIAKLVAENKSLGAPPPRKLKKGNLILRFDELITLLTAEPELATPIRRDNLLRKNYRPKLSEAAKKLVEDVTAACIRDYRLRNNPQLNAPPAGVIAQQKSLTFGNRQHTNQPFAKVLETSTFHIPIEILQRKIAYYIPSRAKIDVKKNRSYELSKKRQLEINDEEKQIQRQKRNAAKRLRDHRARQRNARRTGPQGTNPNQTSNSEQPADKSSLNEAEEDKAISTDDETLEKRLQRFQPNKKRKID